MTDAHVPTSDGELLSAYLAGELPDAEVALLEHRLAAEPALAAQLDALAAALVGLAAADTAQLPDGFEQRLRDRLGEERGQDPGVVDLAVARAQRRAPTRWWATVGTVAAVAAAGAVMASGALRGMGGMDSGETTAADAPVMESQDEAAGSGGADGDDAAEDSAAMVQRPTAPTILDENVRLRDEEAVAERFASAPEVSGLLGTPIEEAAELSDSFTAAVTGADGFADGTSPAACLETVTAGATQPLVPVRVETVRYDGVASLGYALVTATPGASTLHRVEVWVVATDDCATQVFVQQ